MISICSISSTALCHLLYCSKIMCVFFLSSWLRPTSFQLCEVSGRLLGWLHLYHIFPSSIAPDKVPYSKYGLCHRTSGTNAIHHLLLYVWLYSCLPQFHGSLGCPSVELHSLTLCAILLPWILFISLTLCAIILLWILFISLSLCAIVLLWILFFILTLMAIALLNELRLILLLTSSPLTGTQWEMAYQTEIGMSMSGIHDTLYNCLIHV